jgi:hypothetical protein
LLAQLHATLLHHHQQTSERIAALSAQVERLDARLGQAWTERQAAHQAHGLVAAQLLQVQEALEQREQQGRLAATAQQQQIEAMKTEQARDLAQTREKARAQLQAVQAQLDARTHELAQVCEQLRATHTRNDAERQAERQTHELMVEQLLQVQEALEQQMKKGQQLQAHLDQILHPPAPTGAADRVKAHLSYRLGATMIRQSKSATGWLTMPLALWQVNRQFQLERRSRPPRRQPPLHTYGDAQEAERVKRHLSYRLGQALIGHTASPLGWLMLPFALRREVRLFRQSQHPL